MKRAGSSDETGHETGPTKSTRLDSVPKLGRVLLNVGGTRDESSVDTLVNGGIGYFATRFGPTAAYFSNAEDEIFIDCDGALFGHVLHWMRRRKLPAAIHDHERLLMDVAGEADFFGLDDLQAACAQRLAEVGEARQPKPRTARSFSLLVAGRRDPDNWPSAPGGCWWGDDESEMPQALPGEVVYVHSAVLAGPFARLMRITNESDGEPSCGNYADTSCYLHSGRKRFAGDFQLQYMRREFEDDADAELDPDSHGSKVHVLAHRGLDDAGITSDDITGKQQPMHDLNFREVLDVVFDSRVRFRAVGLGDWHLHGWVGPIEEIPRVGVPRTASRGPALAISADV